MGHRNHLFDAFVNPFNGRVESPHLAFNACERKGFRKPHNGLRYTVRRAEAKASDMCDSHKRVSFRPVSLTAVAGLSRTYRRRLTFITSRIRRGNR